MPFDRANRLWQAYVEPKFSYACGVWMQESNDKAHVAVNNVQRNGARLLLGISTMDEANTDPPPCAALLEANLKPAHVLRIMGLLRFRRIVLSRDKSSTLHQVWAVIEFHAATTDEHSLNDEVHRLQQKYSNQIGDTRSRIQNTNRSEKNWWITSRNKKCGPGNNSTYALLAKRLRTLPSDMRRLA